MNALTIKKIKKFQSIKRGYYSFIFFAGLCLLSLFAETLVNSRALMVCHKGEYYFPTYGKMISGKTFGLDYEYETNYKELKKIFSEKKQGDYVLMPPVPYNAYENDLKKNSYPPFPPSYKSKHYLGTDNMGRDILARLLYGFRTAIFFALILLAINYTIGISIGSIMGYFGKKFDLFFQRIIEIWSNIPFLYVIIIISSVILPNFFILLFIMALFGWIGITWTIRTMTYKEKEKEYVLAAKAAGASDYRIIFKHIIPNTIAVIVTFAPFSISSGIVALTSLDYLGFGLPAPTPSWGELLAQGSANMSAWWILSSVIASMAFVLIAVSFIGEAAREAFDPKMHSIYE